MSTKNNKKKGGETLLNETIARYKSYCYICENTVNRGQKIRLTEYLHPVTGDIETAWRHPECVGESIQVS